MVRHNLYSKRWMRLGALSYKEEVFAVRLELQKKVCKSPIERGSSKGRSGRAVLMLAWKGYS